MLSKVSQRFFGYAASRPGVCKTGLKSNFTVILGSQWGDEGKGKLVDILSKDYEVCARFNGGANAGHTVVADGKKYAVYDDAGVNLSETDVDKNKKLATESLSYSMKQDEKKWPPMIGIALSGRLGQINRTILMERFKKGTFEIGSSYWPLTPEYNVAKMLTDDMKTAKEEYLKLLKGTIVPPLKKKEIGVTGEDGEQNIEQNIDPANKKKAIEKRKMFWIAVFVTSKLMKEFLETKLKEIKPILYRNFTFGFRNPKLIKNSKVVPTLRDWLLY
jgi:hypothetical protein